MDQHSKVMENVFRVMQELKLKGNKSSKVYQKILDKVVPRFEWFEKINKLASSMCRQLEAAKKK